MRTTIQRGFTLVEMIMVIVITGIIGGMVAVFLKTPIQQYMDVARRAELTDIADTAIRRMARDVRIAVPNSVRVPNPAGTSTYIEFLPTRDGGRYRASGPGDTLIFDGTDTTFDVIGTANVAVGDYVVVGSTQSDGSIAYEAGASGGLRAVSSSVAPTVTLASGLPWTSELSTQRFAVVDNAQQAVTYACVGGGVVNGDGDGQLMRYWGYGFHSAQQTPTGIAAHTAPVTAHSAAILANKVDCNKTTIEYDVPNQRFGLLAVRLTLTSSNESVSLYNEIHVNNAP